MFTEKYLAVAGFIVFFITFVAILVVINRRAIWLPYLSLPTYDEYADKYPNLVKKGRVICSKCDGTHIRMRSLVNGSPTYHTHYCVTCGTALYRSQHE